MKKLILAILFLFTVSLSFGQQNYESIEEYDSMMDSSNFQEVISTIQKKDPSTVTEMEHFYLGVAYFYLENDEEAQKYLKLAIDEMPDFFGPYYYLAGIYFYSDKYDEALPYYNKCLEIKDNFPLVYNYLGYIYQAKNNLEKSLECFLKYHELEPNPEAIYNLAYNFYLMSDFENAVRYAKEYYESDKNSFSIANILVCSLYSQGKYEEAEPYKNQLIKIWSHTKDRSIKNQKFFILYSFEHAGYEIDVYEKFSKKGNFYYPMTCNIKKNGNVIKTVNLEYDAITEELTGKTAYFVGIDEPAKKKHSTLDIVLSEYPTFDDFIEIVKDALDGKYGVAASSQNKK